MTDLRDVNLNRLAVFVAVVEAGSLTAAAERLGLAKTMVSTHMQRLEAELGISLLTRTTRRLNVTEAGRIFYEGSCQVLRAAEDALGAVGGDPRDMRGTLRVSTPVDYGALVVAPALVALRHEHPGLEVELLSSDQYVDLVGEGIDVAIRLGKLADSNYRAVKIGVFERWAVASPSFVQTWGTVDEPAALASLPFIALSNLPRPWTLALEKGEEKQNVRCARSFQTNTAPACRAATLAGGGFSLMTDFSVREDVAAGRLIRLLPGWASAPASIQAVFPPTRFPSGKVRALIEAVKAQWLAMACYPMRQHIAGMSGDAKLF